MKSATEIEATENVRTDLRTKFKHRAKRRRKWQGGSTMAGSPLRDCPGKTMAKALNRQQSKNRRL